MKLASFAFSGKKGLGLVGDDHAVVGLLERDDGFPGHLMEILRSEPEGLARAGAALRRGRSFAVDDIEFLVPIEAPGKIVCIGLNYVDHSRESGFIPPEYPTVFARFPTSLVAHRQAIIRPSISDQLDYEGELVAVIGRACKHVSVEDALDHIAGYSIFNEGSIRDFQVKSPQWSVGKNFDRTGGFGPCFVTADELPPGARGLRIETRLNGEVVQHASTDDMIFDVATLVSTLSQAITFLPGDVIVTGTPAGVGVARTPKLFMKPGDLCEVEIEGIGILRNPIEAEN